jgi:N-acetylmuramoyl-L-alanine amidase
MSGPEIRDHLLPYVHRLGTRPVSGIDLVVVHCTELPDLATAREFGERIVHSDGSGNSGHYYIERGGSIERHVPPERIAHHTRGYNPRSVGIELVNIGRYPNWFDSRHQAMTEPYPDAQLLALERLLARLRAELPNLGWIAGHEDLDTGSVEASDDPAIQVRRKRDPGPLFPWPRILAACGLKRMGTAERPV